MFTLPIGLLFFRQYYGAAGGANWNLILAGTVISAIPVLIIFLLFQRYFVQGFHLSGIKQ
jgi:multiple sugar transport system permease protein